MLEDKVAFVLQKYLGNYVQGLSKEALSISVWKGDVELKNMKLRPEALNELNLPMKVKSGFLGSIKLKVPWSRLGQEPVLVYFDRIFLMVEPATNVEACTEEFYMETKRKKIKEMELKLLEADHEKDEEANPSWLGSLINTIIGNIKLSITNIHIRFEDNESHPGHPFAVGITLEKLSAVTVDDQGRETFVTGGALEHLQKSVELERLAVYFDSDTKPWKIEKSWEDLHPSEWSKIFEPGIKGNEIETKAWFPKDRYYVLHPVSGYANYAKLGDKDSRSADQPVQKSVIILDDVTLCLSQSGYEDTLKLAENISSFNKRLKYAHYRPLQSIGKNARPWWHYACKVLMEQQRKASGRLSWEQLMQYARLRKRYVSCYVSCLQAEPSRAIIDDNKEINEMDRDLDLEIILQWRMIAHSYVKKTMGNDILYKNKRVQRGWWPFASANQDDKGDNNNRVRSLSTEEWDQINKLIGYKEGAGDPFLTLQGKTDMLHTLLEVYMKRNASKLMTNGYVLMELSSEGLQCSMKIFPVTKEFSLKLQSYQLSSPEGLLIESAMKYDSLKATFCYMPFDRDVDWALYAKSSPCYMTYLKDSIDQISRFFDTSNSLSQTVALETAAAVQMTFNQVKKNAQLQLNKALQQQTRFSLNLDIAAPKVTIPTGFFPDGISETKLLLDLGHFKLDTEEIREWEDPQERDLYIQFKLSLNEVSAFLVDGQYEWQFGHDIEKTQLLQPKRGLVLPVLDKCGILINLQQIRIPHPGYPETRIAARLPSLGFHFSPARYHRIMKIARLFQNESSVSVSPWDFADFCGWLRVLSWKGVGNREAVWQHRYCALVGPFLYILEASESKIYKHRVSLSGKQVFTVPEENVGNVQNVLAVCDVGQQSNKVAESGNALILQFEDDYSRKTWQKRLQAAIYKASASAAVSVPDDSALSSDSGNLLENHSSVTEGKRKKIFLTGMLDELKVIFSSNFQRNQNMKNVLLVKEHQFLEFRALGMKMEFAIMESDVLIGALLETLEIEDLFISKSNRCRQFLARSFIEARNKDKRGEPVKFARKHIRKPHFKERLDTSEFYFDTSDDLADTKDEYKFEDSRQKPESYVEYFDAESSLPTDRNIYEMPTFKQIPGLLPDLKKGTEQILSKQMENMDSFVTARIILYSQESPSYMNLDKEVVLSLATLSFYFNRPTIFEIMNFMNAITFEDLEEKQESESESSSSNIYDTTTKNDTSPSYERKESVVMGLLGKGKDRVIFSLVLNMARAQFVLNNENGTQLASLAQDNLHIGVKVFPSSFAVRAILGNLKICDCSLDEMHPYYWICDMRDIHGSSFVQLSFTSFNPEDEDYQGFEYSLSGELSEVRIVYLNRFVQEVLAYFMGLSPKDSNYSIKVTDKISDSERWFTASEIEGSPALKLNLSLRKPILIMPRSTDSLDFLELDVFHVALENHFEWVGGGKDEARAVRLENMSLVVNDVNLIVGVNGELGERIIEDVSGLSLSVRRSLRDLWHQIPNIEACVKINKLRAGISDKEYQVITECASANMSEKTNCAPPLNIKTGNASNVEIVEEDTDNVSSEGAVNFADAWVSMKITVEVNIVELGLHTGSSRDAPLATMQIVGAWFLYKACSNGEGLVMSTLKSFSVTDDRIGTMHEFRHAIGKASNIGYSPFDWVHNNEDGNVEELHSTFSDNHNLESAPMMLIVDVTLSKSLQKISVSIQRPQLLVALDFLLAVAEFFIPSLPGSFSAANQDNLFDMSNGIILNQPTYHQEADEISLSPRQPLVVDHESYDNFVYDGNGGRLRLLNKFEKDLTEPSKEPLIFIGNGKSLQFKNIVIQNGEFLDSCIFLGSNSSYSVHVNDGVFIDKNECQQDVLEKQPSKDLSRIGSNQNKKSPVTVIVELQAIGPELTFYTSNSAQTVNKLSQKLLHAEVDIFSRLQTSEDGTEVTASFLGLRVEASSGVRVIEPFDTVIKYKESCGKKAVNISISELFINFSYSILQLFMRIEEDIMISFRMTSKKATVECYQFDKIWTDNENSSKQKFAFWRPQAPPGFAVLGDCITPTDEPPSKGVIALNTSYAKVKKPLRFQLVWSSCYNPLRLNEHQTVPEPDIKEVEYIKTSDLEDTSEQDECTVWIPIAPDGYIALGCIVSCGRQPPSQSSTLCVSASLLTPCPFQDCIFINQEQNCGSNVHAFLRVDNSLGSFLPSQSETYQSFWRPYDLRQVAFAWKPENSEPYAENLDQNRNISCNEKFKCLRISGSLPAQYIFQNVVHFEQVWSNKGISSKNSISIWRPICPPGCVFVGDIALHGYEPPSVSVSLQDDETLFKAPLNFQKVAVIKKNRGIDALSFWFPQAPPGYVALGCIASKSLSKPEVGSLLRCIRYDLVGRHQFPDTQIWDTDELNHIKERFSIWTVDHKVGTFFVWKESKKPPRRFAVCLSSQNSEQSYDTTVEAKLQRLSATLFDDFGGSMVPLLKFALNSVTFSSYGLLNNMYSALRLSMLVKSFNERCKSWEPLIEPVDGCIGYESNNLPFGISRQMRITFTNELNMNLSVSNTNLLLEAASSWNRLNNVQSSSKVKDGHSEGNVKYVLDKVSSYIIPQNKLGCDLFLRIIEFGGKSEVIALPPGDVITVKVPAPESVLDPHSKGPLRKSLSKLVTIVIGDAEFPIQKSMENPEYMVVVKPRSQLVEYEEFQPQIQAVHTRCIKPVLDSESLKVHWNEVFYIKLDTEGPHTIEIIVTDPIKDVCVGSYSYPLDKAVSLSRRASSTVDPRHLNLAWEDLCTGGPSLEDNASKKFKGKIRLGVFTSSIFNDEIYPSGFSSGIKTGVIQIGPSKKGPWTTVNMGYSASVGCWKMGQNFIASQLSPSGNNKHLIIRSLVSVFNHTDFPLELCLFPDSPYVKLENIHQRQDYEQQRRSDVEHDEVFENERFHPSLGWGSSCPGHLSPSDPGHWTRREDSYCSQDFPHVSLPNGWEWISDWHIDQTELVSPDGWTYATDFQHLKWPPQLDPEGLTTFARRRRWIRARKRVSNDKHHPVSIGTLNPGDSVALPMDCVNSHEQKYYLQLKPVSLVYEDTYTWSEVVTSKTQFHSSLKEEPSKDDAHHLCISSLGKCEKLICSSVNDSANTHKNCLWFCLCIKGTEIGKDEYSNSIHDWKLVVTAPLTIDSFLPVSSEFAIFEKHPEGKTSVSIRDILKRGETKNIYDADLRRPLYLSLIPQGGWEPLQEIVLVHHPKKVGNPFYVLRSSSSGRMVQVVLDFNKDSDSIAKALRLYTPYWLECVRCPQMKLRFMSMEEKRLCLSKQRYAERNILEQINQEEIENGLTMLSSFNPKSMSLAIALPNFEEASFRDPTPLSSLIDSDGSVDLKAYGTDNESIRLFISTKPCPYQSAPTKVLCIRPYMTFTNRTGQCVYIKLNVADREKVLQPSDSRVTYCMVNTEEPEKFQIRLANTKWSYPLELKEDTIIIAMQKEDATRLNVRADIRGYEEGSRFLIVFRLGSENGPYRFENRTCMKMIRFRQSGLDDQTWQLLKPLSSTNYGWENPCGNHVLDVHVEDDDISFSLNCNIDMIGDCYVPHGMLLHIVEYHGIKVVKFFDDEREIQKISSLEPKQRKSKQIVSASETESEAQLNTSLECILEVGKFGISIIDQRPREVLYLYLENLCISYSTAYSGKESRLKARLGYLQLDNQLSLTSMPVLLSPELPIDVREPVFKMTLTMSNETVSGTEVYPYIGFQVTENCWRVNVHEPVIWALMDLQKSISFPGSSVSSNVSQVDPEIRINKIYITEVRLRFSLETAPAQRPHGIFGIWTPIITTLGNVAKMQIHFRRVDRTSKFIRKSSVMPAIVNQIWKDLIHNPFHLVSGINVIGMTSSTLATLSKGFAKLSVDRQYLMLRSKQDRSRRIMGVGDGILHGSEALAQGVAFGVSGVVTKPLSSAREYGIKGFVQGLGRAFVGFVVQPVSGALDFASLTVHGIGATCTRFREIFETGYATERIRLPRAIRASGILEEYDARTAFGQMLLQLAESSRHIGCANIFKEPSKFAWTDFYEEHFDMHHGHILLFTNRRILLLQCDKMPSNPSKIIWDVPWDKLLTLELIKGRGDVSHIILHLRNFRRSEIFVRLIRYQGENQEATVSQTTIIYDCIQRLWRTYQSSKRASDIEIPNQHSASSISRVEATGHFRRTAGSSSSQDSVKDKSPEMVFASLKFREHTVTFENVWNTEQDPRSLCILCPNLSSEEKEVCSIWRPICPEGYISVGDVAHRGRHPPTATAIYRYNKADFASPVGFELVWRNCQDDYVRAVSIWIPIAPQGFVPIGCVAVADYVEPDVNTSFCVCSRLVEETEFEGDPIWTSPDGYPWSCYIYQVQSEALQFIAMRRRKEFTTWKPYKVKQTVDEKSF